MFLLLLGGHLCEGTFVLDDTGKGFADTVVPGGQLIGKQTGKHVLHNGNGHGEGNVGEGNGRTGEKLIVTQDCLENGNLLLQVVNCFLWWLHFVSKNRNLEIDICKNRLIIQQIGFPNLRKQS